MSRLAARRNKFVVLEVKRGFIVVNTILKPDKDHPNGYHSHFKYSDKATTCINLIERGLKPYSPKMRESARRILTNDEFRRLRDTEPKQKYKNRR